MKDNFFSKYGFKADTDAEYAFVGIRSRQVKVAKEDRDYRSVLISLDEYGRYKTIEYYEFTTKGKTEKGIHIRSIGQSKVTTYRLTDVPEKYKDIVKYLKKLFKETTWRKSPNVELFRSK